MHVKRSIFLLFLSLILATPLFFITVHHLSEGFSLKKISGEGFEHYETFIPKDNLDWIFSQNFFYLGKGSQCFVFESEDQQYVLKFFRLDRYRLPKVLVSLPLPPFLHQIQKRRLSEKTQNLFRLFQSCAIAYNEIPEECGLIYLHLKKTSDLKKTITLYDKLGRSYKIELDKFNFMVQKKGEMILPFLTRLLNSGQKEEAKKALKNLVQLIQFRSLKGIGEEDWAIHKNLGFCMGKAIFLDVGQFKKEMYGQTLSPKELSEITSRIQIWLHKNDQELAAELEKIITTTTL